LCYFMTAQQFPSSRSVHESSFARNLSTELHLGPSSSLMANGNRLLRCSTARPTHFVLPISRPQRSTCSDVRKLRLSSPASRYCLYSCIAKVQFAASDNRSTKQQRVRMEAMEGVEPESQPELNFTARVRDERAHGAAKLRV